MKSRPVQLSPIDFSLELGESEKLFAQIKLIFRVVGWLFKGEANLFE